ncbi:MAG TPA: CPBP family intramembrane glutamic endopeptidase [Candidatus Acidoferrum sp.]|jgi:membrane protease YdiL (CAAX protease family)
MSEVEIRDRSEIAPPSTKSLFQRHPIASYFVLTFAISWTGAFLVAAPKLVQGEPLPKLTGVLMFPAMLLGPAACGIMLTRVVDGKTGLRDLLSRGTRFRVPTRWYVSLLVPPAAVLLTLTVLKTFVSRAYSPNRFYVGVLFGVAAGILEEIGWMGFAYPKMSRQLSPFRAAVLLGILWGIWHLPVIDFLGAATPHRAAWFPFFLAFTAAMTAMRVIIAWVYRHTRSLPLAQLLHISSTGSLVAFSPAGVSPMQEALWYVAYAALLWLLVLGFVALRRNGNLTTHPDDIGLPI